MYFDHSKRSYYRFPGKNRVTDFDTQSPLYFPDKYSDLFNEYSDLYTDSSDSRIEDAQNRYS